ncbi:GNAT family N-acetyltransferase [Catenovulum sp. 2E275]|uniref:GNAT family N-acetyltransferase n=1 Tax=Catenovulum sp. 2E275 TaxID=2980497 RepID=UPI0021D35FDE|nr:GNAT family N-acetyltransferase [Catenovulum sp. 2E275]MCU4674754.1 GNAT family N-acetyltransferase [Catenovulum sp. 2E275]
MLKQIDDNNYALLQQWRNQPEIREQMVNQQLISMSSHQIWYESVKHALNQQHFVIYYKDLAIGSINIRTRQAYLYQADSAEVGLYIAEAKYKNNILAFAPSLAINDYAFNDLGINHLASKVRLTNQAAIKYNQQLGYQFSPLDEDFTEIKLTADNYNNATKQLKTWLSRG